MEIYRLKHLPTGLFFTPSKGNGNLSIKGKLYADKKPDVKWGRIVRIKLNVLNGSQPNKLQKILIEYFKINYEYGKYFSVDKNYETLLTDWIIEKIKE